MQSYYIQITLVLQYSCVAFFSCLIALARTSSMILNISGKNGYKYDITVGFLRFPLLD